MKIAVTLVSLILASAASAGQIAWSTNQPLFLAEGDWRAEFHRVPIDAAKGEFCRTGIAVYDFSSGTTELVSYRFNEENESDCDSIVFTRYRTKSDFTEIELPIIEEFVIQVLDTDGKVLAQSQVNSYDRDEVAKTAIKMIESLSNKAVETTATSRRVSP